MIDGIGPTGTARVETRPAARPGAVERPAATRPASEGAAPNPAADLAAEGPPVDAGKVAAIRAAIAGGAYRIDVEAIAAKMIKLDLG